VRILFGFSGGIGHFLPLDPIARAAVAAGHQVAVAGRPQHAAEVESVGYAALPIGSDADEPPSRATLRPLNPVSRSGSCGRASRVGSRASGRRT
jgi:UDP:flavonoid glycosyltransferase YjiC (YdhE family)